MPTCEFCVYASDECLLLKEPIEYDSSGMTIKANCPLRKRYETHQILRNGRETIRSAASGSEQCPAGDYEPSGRSDKENG